MPPHSANASPRRGRSQRADAARLALRRGERGGPPREPAVHWAVKVYVPASALRESTQTNSVPAGTFETMTCENVVQSCGIGAAQLFVLMAHDITGENPVAVTRRSTFCMAV